MTRLGIVAALAPEAAIARRAAPVADPESILVRLSGPGAEAAREAARALVAEGSGALLSFGVAGGLDAALTPGTVVLADCVIGADGTVLATDAAWRARLSAPSFAAGAIAEAARPLRTPADKASVRTATGAVAVDMESFAVACVAGEAGIPFLAVRAIADAAGRAVPEAAMRAYGPDGRIRPLAALAGFIARPAEAWEFVVLARDGGAAFRGLRRVALDAPGFALV